MARVGGAGGAANHPLLVLLLWLCATTTTAWAHVGGGGGSDADADAGADGGGAKPDLRTTKGVVAAKLWCQALVFAGALAGGVSPYFMRWNEALLVLGTRFAGGVFVCTGAIHFSDVYETLGDLLPGIGYQFAFMFMILCAGSILADCVISFVVSLGRSGPASSAGAGGIEEGKVSSSEGNSSGTGAAPAIKTKADAWKAPLTISLRKILAAIAMGIALLGMLPDRPFLSFFGYAFVFAISSPIGVGIGIAIDATTQGWVVDWIFAVSMGLAMAIFTNVYNNIFLSKGYKPQRPVGAADTPVARWLAFMLGFIVIVAVMIWDTR